MFEGSVTLTKDEALSTDLESIFWGTGTWKLVRRDGTLGTNCTLTTTPTSGALQKDNLFWVYTGEALFPANLYAGDISIHTDIEITETITCGGSPEISTGTYNGNEKLFRVSEGQEFFVASDGKTVQGTYTTTGDTYTDTWEWNFVLENPPPPGVAQRR